MSEYMRRILIASHAGELARGEVIDVVVAHDGTCGVYKAAACDCDPDIRFRRGKKRMKIDAEGKVRRDRSLS